MNGPEPGMDQDVTIVLPNFPDAVGIIDRTFHGKLVTFLQVNKRA
jgi:hypothetical protein